MDNTQKKLKVIIIDDEKHGRDLLKNLIAMESDDFIVIGEADSVDSGIDIIRKTEPDVVFLDIELSDRSGFEILEHFNPIAFSVIFATAFNYYAIKAIKFSALDYLLKPIDADDLSLALNKLRTKEINLPGANKRIPLVQALLEQSQPDKIAIPTATGFVFVKIIDIITCSSKNNYTSFRLSNKTTLMACHTLKEYESLLAGHDFFRIHNSHLINMNHVHSYIKGKGGFVLMKDGTELEVSTRRKDLFLKQFAKL